MLWLAYIAVTAMAAGFVALPTTSALGAAEDGSVCDAATQDAYRFTDTGLSVHRASIHCMSAHGIVRGKSDGTYDPQGHLSRGQMASMLTSFIQVANPDLAVPDVEAPFADIITNTHRDGITTLHAWGIVSGRTETRYAPDLVLTRQQMATLLFRTYELLGVTIPTNDSAPFTDVSTDNVHAEAINALASADVVSGVSPDRFDPNAALTRGQAASLLDRSATTLSRHSAWNAPPLPDPSEAIDVVVTGAQPAGFTVPEGETWEIQGDVRTEANVVVYGTLMMRAGSSLTFDDIDEEAFVGPGDVHEPVEQDVGLWVFGNGQLDIQGTPKQGWNRTGFHETWEAGDEYVAAPQARTSSTAASWQLGDEVPCVDFADETYCTEIVNLTRDVTIQGTPGGRAHVYIRSDKPQTIRYATLRHLGPNGDGPVDSRYPLHFHMMNDGSKGSLIEGVVVRDAGDHAFVPHHSNGITFRETVAYDVQNTAYWWDPKDSTDDTRYERALALEVSSARDTGARLNGFRMAKGVGNACIECVAVRVSGARPSAGFGWNEAHPNKWEFRDSVAHNNSSGVYHWRNEPHVPGDSVHEHVGFVAYNNRGHGIEQGAYVIQAHWQDTVLFGNGQDGLINRGSPRRDVVPGIAYRGGTLGGDGASSPIAIRKMGSCPSDDNHILFEDLHLLDWGVTPVHVDKSSCSLNGGDFDVRFRHVVVGPDKRDLEPADFQVDALPPGGVITVYRTDGTQFTID